MNVPDISDPNDLPQSSPLSGLFGPGRRRNGKVARLPKPVRDRVNSMLLEGATYLQIIENLGPEANGLNEDNVGSWKSGGYQDWLREQQCVQLVQAKHEFAFDLVCKKDGNKIHQATLQIAAANLCELLVDLDPNTMRDLLQTSPDKYTRLLNAIARLSDGELKHQRHCIQEAEREARLAKDKSSPQPGGISDEALRAAETKLNLL
jgi:hypothetical protein